MAVSPPAEPCVLVITILGGFLYVKFQRHNKSCEDTFEDLAIQELGPAFGSNYLRTCVYGIRKDSFDFPTTFCLRQQLRCHLDCSLPNRCPSIASDHPRSLSLGRLSSSPRTASAASSPLSRNRCRVSCPQRNGRSEATAYRSPGLRGGSGCTPMLYQYDSLM